LAVCLTAHLAAWVLVLCRPQMPPSTRRTSALTTTSAQRQLLKHKYEHRCRRQHPHQMLTLYHAGQRGQARSGSTMKTRTKVTARAMETTLRQTRQARMVRVEDSRGARHNLSEPSTRLKWVAYGGDMTSDLIFSHIRLYRAFGFGFSAGVTQAHSTLHISCLQENRP
jgi:hypothetical protein